MFSKLYTYCYSDSQDGGDEETGGVGGGARCCGWKMNELINKQMNLILKGWRIKYASCRAIPREWQIVQPLGVQSLKCRKMANDFSK